MTSAIKVIFLQHPSPLINDVFYERSQRHYTLVHLAAESGHGTTTIVAKNEEAKLLVVPATPLKTSFLPSAILTQRPLARPIYILTFLSIRSKRTIKAFP